MNNLGRITPVTLSGFLIFSNCDRIHCRFPGGQTPPQRSGSLGHKEQLRLPLSKNIPSTCSRRAESPFARNICMSPSDKTTLPSGVSRIISLIPLFIGRESTPLPDYPFSFLLARLFFHSSIFFWLPESKTLGTEYFLPLYSKVSGRVYTSELETLASSRESKLPSTPSI